MGLFSNLYTSVSGLMATESGLTVIGNNIANLNTTGFKGSRVLFSDVLDTQIEKVGKGVKLQSAEGQFIQGNLQPSNNPLDFAIDGNGFFIVSDPNNNAAEYYTRDGAFLLDKDGYIINANNLRLRGYMADSSGTIGTTISDIQMPTDANGNITVAASATTEGILKLNLDARDPAPSVAWSLSATTGPAEGSYNHSAEMSIYDSEGNKHAVDVYFRKIQFNSVTQLHEWTAYFVYNSMKTSSNYQQAGSINLTFDTSGILTSASVGSGNFTWGADDWDGDSGTADTTPAAQTISFDLADSTQYASSNSVSFVQTDGYPEGSLVNFSTDKEGIMSGLYSNGQVRNLAQLAIALFLAPTELEKIGDNLFAESSGSGSRTEATPGAQGAGTVSGQYLEMSNVDLASEFVTMLMLQRAFQANGRVMSTTDEMLTKLVNI